MSTTITSFDGTEECVTDLEEPDRYSSLLRAIGTRPFAVRGAGLSYCLAGAGREATISTRHFNRVLAFDR